MTIFDAAGSMVAYAKPLNDIYRMSILALVSISMEGTDATDDFASRIWDSMALTANAIVIAIGHP